MVLDNESAVSTLTERQETLKAIANLPTEFVIDGRTIKIISLPPRKMAEIDCLVIDLNKHTMVADEGDPSKEEYYDKRKENVLEFYRIGIDILYLIINKDTDNPEFSKDWIWDHISFAGDNSIGKQILDSYDKSQSSVPFFTQALALRKLG